MGFTDLGTAICAPLLGSIIDLEIFNRVGYPQMFLTAGLTPMILGCAWQLWHRGRVDNETIRSTV